MEYIQNRAPHKSLDGKIPYEAWFGHKPNISHFRIFGSRAWARIPSEKRKALQPQIKEWIMVGYDEYTRRYNIFYPSTQNTFIEISVQFEEEVIPDIELALGECSSPPPQDDVKDEYFLIFSDIYDYDMD